MALGIISNESWELQEYSSSNESLFNILGLSEDPPPPRKCFQYLYLGVEMSENIVDLILESSGQHLVSFIQYKLLDITGPAHKQGLNYSA